jgi:hypothetical protein
MNHRHAIERMYTDRATIMRVVETQKESGETVQSIGPVAVYEEEPCYLSQIALGKNSQTEAQNDVLYESKLFIAPELVIKQGDVIEVTRAGRLFVYTAGEPFPPYSSHQELSLQRRGYA